MIPKHPNSFRKAERLCSHQALEQLYATGESMLVYPLRCVYRRVEYIDEPLRIMITVPKKNHRRAVDRNLLKRRIRESYRLNRGLYLEQTSESSQADTPLMALEFAVSYIAKDILDYQIIESAFKKILKKLEHCPADLTH